MPCHLRWDLYPIPRPGPAGSKYQQADGAGPRRHHRLAEVMFMAEEILLLRKVFAQRRGLWIGSWLMHAGLYLGSCFLALLLAAAGLSLLGMSPDIGQGMLARVLRTGTVAIGLGGMVAGLAGTLWLLALRLTDRGLRSMSDPVSYFNLALLAAMFAAGLAVWWGDPGFAHCRAHLASLLCGRPSVVGSPWLTTAIVLTTIFAVCFPFGRMFHPVAKYFFYHKILWDNEPVRPGSAMEEEIGQCLGRRVGWSAEHVVAGGTWLDQVQSPGSKGESPHEP
jgi:nitrate reductase gamma subunit